MRKSFSRAASIVSIILFFTMMTNTFAGPAGEAEKPGLNNADVFRKAVTALKEIDTRLTGGRLQVALEKIGLNTGMDQTDTAAFTKNFTKTPYALALAGIAALWVLGPAVKPLRRKVEHSLEADREPGAEPRKKSGRAA